MSPEEAIWRIQDHIEIHSKKEKQAVLIAEALQLSIGALYQIEESKKIIHCIECKYFWMSPLGDFECKHKYGMMFPVNDGFCNKAEPRESR